jgi:hypothetical protein
MRVINMAKKAKKYRCPHCKKVVRIEDLEVIEDTRSVGSGTVLLR